VVVYVDKERAESVNEKWLGAGMVYYKGTLLRRNYAAMNELSEG